MTRSVIPLDSVKGPIIHTVEMHTTGEATRIVYGNYPNLTGTLLAQRAEARKSHDHIRQLLVQEPRGHREMYGAVLRTSTELVDEGKAHMGVLFLTNEGYSTMCGHATIALGRFLVDTWDVEIFPRRNELEYDQRTQTVKLDLHAPCGLVNVTVPVRDGGKRSDETRPVEYLSVPSFAAGIGVEISLAPEHRWSQLGERNKVTVDVGYGGAFYVFASAAELGFATSLTKPDMAGLNLATRRLKAAFNASDECRKYLFHPDSSDLQFLYSIIVTDTETGIPSKETAGAETGLCFFADQQVDRSPTGSGVQARVALAYAKSERTLGESWTYHSLVSNAFQGKGAFVGSPVEEVDISGKRGVRVRVSGFASYTGWASYVVEEGDEIAARGFSLETMVAE